MTNMCTVVRIYSNLTGTPSAGKVKFDLNLHSEIKMFNVNTKNAQKTADGSWVKATAFINISLPANTKSGVRKFGAISLKADKKGMAELIEYLKLDPANVSALMAEAVYDFQMADSDQDDSGFTLPKA